MCDPVTLTIAATAITAGGQIMSGISQQQQSNYAAGIATRNAGIAANQAKDAEANTQKEAQRRYRQSAQSLGAQQASLAANGVDINFGTSVALQGDSRMFAAEDVGQIYKAGSERAKGFDNEAYNYRAESEAQKAKGRGAMMEGLFGAAGTALGGATQVSKLKKGIA